jgi:hypothetical protein
MQTGIVKLRYNHYCEEMSVEHEEGGSCSVKNEDIIELLSLDYAFNGSFVVHLNALQSKPRMKRLWQDKEGGLIPGISIGKEYWVDVDEDTVAEASVVRKSYNPDVKEEAPREEGCSCIWGNPCAEAYSCKDWKNRFDVAKANGWKGF